MTEIMGKETWIKSRTNNPDRVGKAVWGNLYGLSMLERKGTHVLAESKKTLKPLYMEMEKDFLAKMGIPFKVNESNWEYILNFMNNTDSDQNLQAMKLGLEAGLKMIEKKSAHKKSLLDTLKEGTKHLFIPKNDKRR